MTERIQSPIRCRRCQGTGSLEGGEPCPRCEGGLRFDPESYRGCIHECDLVHPAGEHCSEPVGAEGRVIRG